MKTGSSQHDISDYVSINKAMKIAGVSRRTIYNWMAAGKLETARTAGGSIRINPSSLGRVDNGKANQSGTN